MKNNDCLFSNIQILCNTVSDWLIQKINNPIEPNETISYVITAEPVNADHWWVTDFTHKSWNIISQNKLWGSSNMQYV